MTKLISRPALLVAVLLSSIVYADEPVQPVASPPPAAQPMPVYDTTLAPGWSNWSWAKTELSVELKGSTRKPIKVEAGPYQALYLQHAAFPTNGYTKISLLIQGSAPDGEVRLYMLTDGKINGEGKLIKLANTGWTQVVVPLVTLAAEDKLVDGIWVQNATGSALPRFYVTEIKIE
ncbi:MAG: hypothetical protein ABI821_00710 [Pseudomonadota bacterium]